MDPGSMARDGGATVLLLHCSASSGRQWDGLASMLPAPLRHVAPDLYGYGDSPPWSGAGPLSLSAEADRASAALTERAGPVHVVGHSYGGAVAMRFALEQPWRVATLTLIEPVAFHILAQGGSRDRRLLESVRSVAGAVIRGALSGDYGTAMARFVNYWNGDSAWERMPTEARERLQRFATKVVLDFHAAISEPVELAEYRRRFTFPVRILRGELSPEPVRRIAALLYDTLPDADLVTVPGAGHMLPLTHAGPVNAAAVDIIAGWEPGRRQAA